MAYTHTNKIVYAYTAGGAEQGKTVSKSETHGAEMNVSQAITTDASSETANIDLEYFEFTTKLQARSVFIMLTGFNGALYGGVAGASKMVDLDDGEPYVWSSSDGSTGNFPAGNTNPMIDATDRLRITPDAGAGTGTSGTITVKVLYDPGA